MVNAEVIFNRILTIDTLIKFNAVIPSLADLQLKLVNLLELLINELAQQGYEDDDLNALLRLMCRHLDRSAEKNSSESHLSWQGYSLETYFFGYNAEQADPQRMIEQLRKAKGLSDDVISKILAFISDNPQTNASAFSVRYSVDEATDKKPADQEQQDEARLPDTFLSANRLVSYLHVFLAGALLVGSWFFLSHCLR